MGRLTERDKNGNVGLINDKQSVTSIEVVENVEAALEKLAHYEDLEEQGRLITLSCAVGDTVYVIDGVRWVGYDWKWQVYDEAYVREIKFNLDMLGDCFFITEEEAERELKRLKLITDPNVGSAS